MNTKTKALVGALTKALADASSQLLDAACTCVDRSNGHELGCSGLSYTKDFDKLVEKARKLLEAKPASASFPMEYKGWRIEIKMGREFKGTRGSVKSKRGYVATRLSDGKVQEFAPSYDTNPNVQAVKIMIDAEERAKELYAPTKSPKIAENPLEILCQTGKRHPQQHHFLFGEHNLCPDCRKIEEGIKSA